MLVCEKNLEKTVHLIEDRHENKRNYVVNPRVFIDNSPVAFIDYTCVSVVFFALIDPRFKDWC